MTHPVFAFADELTEWRADLEPSQATYYGVGGRDDRWEDFGPDGVAARHDAFVAKRRALDELPAGDDQWSRLALRAVVDDLDNRIGRFERNDDLRDLNSAASPIQHIRQMADLADKSSAAGWDALVTRLEGMDRALAGYRETLELGRRKGLHASRRQAEAVHRQATTHAGDDSSLLLLAAELEERGFADNGRADALASAIDRARAGFGAFAAYVADTYLPAAPEGDAMGRERYVPAARYFLGDDIDPEETYAWGWEEVARLRAAMIAIADRLDPGVALDEVLARIVADPALQTADRDEFVSVMSARLTQAVADLDGAVFDIPEPVKEVTVNIAPPGGPLGAYYVSPSEDWSRPGSVWYSLAPDEQRVSLASNVSTNYHEGFPGHHLQVGTQVALADKLCRYHRVFIWWSGSGEGWALYAERLMHELGYLERPEYELGYLAESMLRASRVVIDIGSHLELPMPDGQPFHPGQQWSFELGVEMLRRYANQSEAYARSEMTRYLGWPGQAIAYKVGERIIVDMRQELERRGGFDLKRFHATVLEHPVALAHLRHAVLGS